MSTRVIDIPEHYRRDEKAGWVVNMWDRFNHQRWEWLQEKRELRNYIFATSTRDTTNAQLPWKNSTTLPKLCQIRDNLHSNYLQAMFPNQDWLRWEGADLESSEVQKANVIESYMANKAREGGLRGVVSRLLYDYIDYGNAFAMPDYERNYKEDVDGSKIPGFIGPVLRRISPEDIVFDPTATSFKDSPKIVRSMKSWGEIVKMAEDQPENMFLKKAVERREWMRSMAGSWNVEDFNKQIGYSVDGFGNYLEYVNSEFVEILEFYGDFYDPDTGKLHRSQVITILDRASVARTETLPSWLDHTPIYHVGWRLRPDNLYAMGPLDNLVGMQYRIDHLENLKADAMDLSVHPPVLVTGEVEEFEWGPGAEIQADENGNVVELGKNLGPLIAANNEIQMLEDKMELYAGAPREAMGVRSPGEKTAFEVDTLFTAGQRIFQEKASTFELDLLEPALNGMMEKARRNMDEADVVRVLDRSLGLEAFREITREDITATGKLHPIGARHFGQQAQTLQNLVGIFNSPLGQIIAPHSSGKQLAKMVEDILDLDEYKVFSQNVAIREQGEAQRTANQVQEDLEVEQARMAEMDV